MMLLVVSLSKLATYKLATWKIAVDVIVFLSHYVIVLLLLVAVVFSLMTDFVFFSTASISLWYFAP